MTSNNETVSRQNLWADNIAKSIASEGNSALLLAHVDRRPPLQRGLMNFQLENFQLYNKSLKFLMGVRGNDCQISQNYIFHVKFSEICLCFHNSWEIWPSFSRTPIRNFLWCYYRWLITSLALKKCKKNAIFFKLFWLKEASKLISFAVELVLKRFF